MSARLVMSLIAACCVLTGCPPAPEGGQTSPGASAAPAYACPMHPEVKQDGPGKCPKCGMALVKGGS